MYRRYKCVLTLHGGDYSYSQDDEKSLHDEVSLYQLENLVDERNNSLGFHYPSAVHLWVRPYFKSRY